MNYHNYFISIENRFIELSRFIEIEERNFGTFSSEIALLFLSACSEFEMVSKELCMVLQPEKACKNIYDIFVILKETIPEILEEEILLDRFNLVINPLADWTSKSPPFWWQSYNAVKHDRSRNYHEANIQNLIYAIAGVQLVNYYYLWKFKFNNKSRLAAPMAMDDIPKIFCLKNVSYSGPFSTADVFDI